MISTENLSELRFYRLRKRILLPIDPSRKAVQQAAVSQIRQPGLGGVEADVQPHLCAGEHIASQPVRPGEVPRSILRGSAGRGGGGAGQQQGDVVTCVGAEAGEHAVAQLVQ